jgi:hypothetical protein
VLCRSVGPQDKPFPRGLLWVKTAEVVPGYYRDEEQVRRARAWYHRTASVVFLFFFFVFFVISGCWLLMVMPHCAWAKKR